MGNPCAPTYANELVGGYHRIGNKETECVPWILFWGCYIDDIFILCSDNKKAFVEKLNQD